MIWPPRSRTSACAIAKGKGANRGQLKRAAIVERTAESGSVTSALMLTYQSIRK